MAILLGIDTGGTFTDAVLYDEASGVVAKAKSLTTHHDLAIGVGGAVGAVIEASAIAPGVIALVSLSTTLATNAMVEGQGGRVGLVYIGFDAADAERPDLKAALNGDPVILVGGGHDAMGQPRMPLDAETLAAEARRLAPGLTGFAVTGRFAVLDPSHEIAARDILRRETGLPVTCGHELSARLDGPKRALTCVLNARLIHLLEMLIAATEGRLAALGIQAPLMVVRGDGSLVSAEVAKARPIETIFSGPAASAVGGAFLAGTQEALVSDIGGTTTDVVVLRQGRPRIDPAGALIGGFRTMVEAIAIRTCGLGGDSEVTLEQHGLEASLKLGPRRAIPLSLLAASHGDLVHATLERQLGADMPNDLHGRFALSLNPPLAEVPALEAELLGRLAQGPQPADRLIANRRELNALQRLVNRRLAIMASLTPSDAAHVLGLHAAWDRDAAAKGALLFSRRRNAMGLPFAATPDILARRIIEVLTRRSAEFLLECALAEDGFQEAGLSRHVLAAAALDGHEGLVRIGLSLTTPVVGLGASAATYYGAIAALVGAPALVPEHAEVANAVGAVVGGVHVSAELRILQPVEGVFRVLARSGTRDFGDLGAALAHAEETARAQAHADALEAGAASVEIAVTVDEKKAVTEGREIFVEALVTARASGRPRIGR
ncbi:hydantoinase/oxoprolinase family protein [Labrys monachus]|uniref:N-methylhydantoinase A/oxoprolinase/acetone carboxylase beta subunit n=1 Tax=Labrys monachus TaxID=217067 RepID=A0ABU0FMC8_9HYPH|nr:hydantoinase/oxoprolinase family protein [Labrys monachus]MDQ0395626.1 N-methylhydantoinase A/oxoprolinase/acetone carboxylase beta subunit [Labrys monachus]